MSNVSRIVTDAVEEHRHAEEHVHVFEEAGIEEGNKPIPKWYAAIALGLIVFFIVYIALYFTGVQPNTAR
jgi:hypothetical protein